MGEDVFKKREVRPPAKIPLRKEPSYENQLRYQKRKRRLAFAGKAVRLAREISTRGGTKFAKGTLWRAGKPDRTGKFAITGIDKRGREERDANGNCERFVIGVEMESFVLDPSVPDEPKEPKKPKPKKTEKQEAE
jgi:hypothetical protein